MQPKETYLLESYLEPCQKFIIFKLFKNIVKSYKPLVPGGNKKVTHT